MEKYAFFVKAVREALLQSGSSNKSSKQIANELFKSLDENGSGILSCDELTAFIQKLSSDIVPETSSEDIESYSSWIIDQIDLNRDGTITVKELHEFLFPTQSSSSSSSRELGYAINITKKAIIDTLGINDRSSEADIMKSVADNAKCHLRAGNMIESRSLKKFMRQLSISTEEGGKLNYSEIDGIMNNLDQNGDGVISMKEMKTWLFGDEMILKQEEFIQIFLSFVIEKYSGKLREFFTSFAGEGKDVIYKVDFLQHLAEGGCGLRRDEAVQLVDSFVGSVKANGIITYGSLTDRLSRYLENDDIVRSDFASKISKRLSTPLSPGSPRRLASMSNPTTGSESPREARSMTFIDHDEQASSSQVVSKLDISPVSLPHQITSLESQASIAPRNSDVEVIPSFSSEDTSSSQSSKCDVAHKTSESSVSTVQSSSSLLSSSLPQESQSMPITLVALPVESSDICSHATKCDTVATASFGTVGTVGTVGTAAADATSSVTSTLDSPSSMSLPSSTSAETDSQRNKTDDMIGQDGVVNDSIAICNVNTASIVDIISQQQDQPEGVTVDQKQSSKDCLKTNENENENSSIRCMNELHNELGNELGNEVPSVVVVSHDVASAINREMSVTDVKDPVIPHFVAAMNYENISQGNSKISDDNEKTGSTKAWCHDKSHVSINVDALSKEEDIDYDEVRQKIQQALSLRFSPSKNSLSLSSSFGSLDRSGMLSLSSTTSTSSTERWGAHLGRYRGFPFESYSCCSTCFVRCPKNIIKRQRRFKRDSNKSSTSSSMDSFLPKSTR